MAGLEQTLLDLDAALAEVSDDSMTLSQLDGLIAGVLVCPEAILPSEWLPLVWGAGDDEPAPFESAGQAERVIGLVLAHYNSVAGLLLRDADGYAPILDHHAPTDEMFWEFWIAGFEAGMSLRHEAWAPLFETDDEACQAAALLLTLHGISVRDPDLEQTQKQIDELTAAAPDLIPGCVAVLAQARGRGRRMTPVRRTKVGRNDPCPCGSGLKFKKCCEGRPPDPQASGPH